MRAMVDDGAFMEATEGPVVVSPVFVIPKKDGGRRLIHDLRFVNRFLEAPHFTLHGVRDTASVVRQSAWLCSLDLKRGYQQLLMDERARQYLGANVGGKTFVSTVLPFGLSISPYIFTRYTNWVAGLIRKKTHLKVACYIDDFILGGQSKDEVEQGLKIVRDLFNQLGLILSDKKEVVVAMEVEFLGFRWSAERKTIGVTESRRYEYTRAIKNLLRTPQPVKRWKTLIGKLVFLRDAVGPALRHVRSLLKATKGKGPSTKIAPQGEVEEDLRWWLERLSEGKELSLSYQSATASISTDASDVGLGYVLEIGQVRLERALTADNTAWHINVKELQALLACLREHGHKLTGRKVSWWGDNITALAAVRRQGTQHIGETAWATTKQILDLAERWNIQLVPRYVPSSLNKTADSLSRGDCLQQGWDGALKRISDVWGPCTADPFGFTKDTTKAWEDLDWLSKRALVKPPTSQIPEILNILEEARTDGVTFSRPSTWETFVVLITPTWQRALWWSQLESLRTQWLDLGRHSDKNLKDWESRNGRKPSWTASLVRTKGPAELMEPGRSTRQ